MPEYPSVNKMNDEERINAVKDIFSSITGKYDFLNRFFSLRRDVRWRLETVEKMRFFSKFKMLDVAAGTADLAIETVKQNKNIHAIGVDFVPEMLEKGRQKINRKGLSDRVTLLEGDALELSFSDDYFDVAGMAFGIRNIPDKLRALKEMRRVVVPGGQVMILELTLPANWILKKCYAIYLQGILPKLAKIFSKKSVAYNYLADSIMNFPPPDMFANLMKDADLIKIEKIPLTFGVTHLYIGVKPGRDG